MVAAVASLIALIGINLYGQSHLSFAGKNSPLYCHSFQVFLFSVSMFISLPFGTSLTFLLGLLSAVVIAVALRHLATKSSFYFVGFYLVVFSRRGYCRLAAIVFTAWAAVPFFASLCHLILATIFIALPFSSLPSILSLFSQQYRGFSFKARP